LKEFIHNFDDGALLQKLIDKDIATKLKQKQSVEKILLLKDKSYLSDVGYHEWRTGLNINNLLPSLYAIKNTRQIWNNVISKYLDLNFLENYLGVEVQLQKILSLILTLGEQKLKFTQESLSNILKYKIAFDGRFVGGKEQVLLGLVPLNLGFKVQSAQSVFPLILWEGTENLDQLQDNTINVIKHLNNFKENRFFWNNRWHQLEFFLSCDLKSLWSVTNRKWKLHNTAEARFCLWCDATNSDRCDWIKWKGCQNTDINNVFPIENNHIIPCSLHGLLRITEKLVKLGIQLAVENGNLELLIEKIRTIGIKSFRVWQPKNQTKYTFASFNSKQCNLILQQAEYIVPIFAPEDNRTLFIWTNWREIMKILSQDNIDIDGLENKLLSWGELYVSR
jgi:hypothetical protein